ncbi:MAG: SUMF1/EgtB/PvdO family nonheme iron enzyme [Fuerstiella sp.]|nr:SUMF1/EgtB/PvdO family nonheme iron enzyme [Fuerstiella sp.]MCP4854127.1 SUMF1/EgtB/PvdO family nonheme iron enzyme [Fuerstiella sp.]
MSSCTELAGSKLPNGWGLFDVHGNVWEWCHDLHGPFDSAATVSDPLGPRPSPSRLLRGGSFFYPTSNVHSGYRDYAKPAYGNYNGGFRPARTYNLSP